MTMSLASLATPAGAADAAARALWLMADLYPICRSITGDGVRRTLDLLERHVTLARTEVPSGTPVFDWEVPREWNVRDAYVARTDGTRVIDFRAHNLHLVNYSAPFRGRLRFAELRPHLHAMPSHPDWIPYRTSYYRETWGFCLRQRDLDDLAAAGDDALYDVVVDTTLAPGHLTYAEAVIPGSAADGEMVVHTHTCHPSLANDNLTGIAVATALASAMRAVQPRLTWRFVFGPGTIGSLSWLSRNEHRIGEVRGGLVIGLLGDPGPLTWKRSRRGDTATDRAAEQVLAAAEPTLGVPARIMDFEPYGYDERQFCSPGFDLPVGRLTRSPNAAYPQYHSSADNLDLVSREALAESIRVLAQLIATLDANRWITNLSPRGEPRLGKRGLYGTMGGTEPGRFENALLWLLSQGDGTHDLVGVAARSGLPFELVAQAATALEGAGLLSSTSRVPLLAATRGSS